jgi:hypothetical protein
MGLWDWLRGRSNNGDPRLSEWRRAWAGAAMTIDERIVSSLETRLNAFALPDDEVEIEREMLEAARELVRLRVEVHASGLPTVETGHRVIGTDSCHYCAPVSMPDDPAQPSGRLLLTGARAVFAGGARTTSVPWHAVTEIIRAERDIVLIRNDREHLHRFRCNTFADALCGAFLAQRLIEQRQPARGARTPSTATAL